MASARGISGLFRSVASNLARAPPPLGGTRGGFSRCSSRPFASSTAGSNNKDCTCKLGSAKEKMACFVVYGGLIYMYGWFLPRLNSINDNLDAAEKARLKREEEVIEFIKHELRKYSECPEYADAAEKARLKREEELIKTIKHEFQKYRECPQRYAQDRTPHTSSGQGEGRP